MPIVTLYAVHRPDLRGVAPSAVQKALLASRFVVVGCSCAAKTPAAFGGITWLKQAGASAIANTKSKIIFFIVCSSIAVSQLTSATESYWLTSGELQQRAVLLFLRLFLHFVQFPDEFFRLLAHFSELIGHRGRACC